MTLDEAIAHCKEKAKELRTEAEQLRDIGEVMSSPKQPYNKPVKNCLECANEHEQLAEWLKELKDYREGSRVCKNCANRNRKSKEVCTSPYGICSFFEDKTQEGGSENERRYGK